MIAFGFLKKSCDLGLREPRDFIVFTIPIDTIEVEDKITRAKTDTSRKILALINTGGLGVETSVNHTVNRAFGNAAINHVYDTADRTTPIGDRSRSAKDLDMFSFQSLTGHSVVGAIGGGVDRVDAIDEDANTIRAQAPNDGAAGGGTKESRRHTRLVGDRIGDGAAEVFFNMVLVDHVNKADRFIQADTQGRRRHNDHILHRIPILGEGRNGQSDENRRAQNRSSKQMAHGPLKRYKITFSCGDIITSPHHARGWGDEIPVGIVKYATDDE